MLVLSTFVIVGFVIVMILIHIPIKKYEGKVVNRYLNMFETTVTVMEFIITEIDGYGRASANDSRSVNWDGKSFLKLPFDWRGTLSIESASFNQRVHKWALEYAQGSTDSCPQMTVEEYKALSLAKRLYKTRVEISTLV